MTDHDDHETRKLLRTATERNYHWPPEVTGFAATVGYFNGSGTLNGQLDAASPRELKLALPEAAPEDLRWCETELRSMIGHRLFRTFEQGDGRYQMSLESSDEHPFGLLIRLHGDPNQSSYRVSDGMLRQANRTAGPRHFTLSVHSVKLLDEEHYIAQNYSVLHFANDGGQLIRADVYTDDYTEVDGVWLPCLRRIVSADDHGLHTRELRFSHHAIHRAPSTDTQPEAYDQLRAKREHDH